MSEIVYQGTYNEFKTQMDIEIKEAAAGFVRIGYLLKVARDTNVLEVSGYKSVADFAKAEYGLTKDMVSRYIAINDKYSENGYSDQLLEKYKSYGVAKLAEMLTLPDEIAEQIPADMTKKEIQEIKRDYKEELEISDIEVMLEEKNENKLENNLEQMLYEYFRQPSMFKEYFETYDKLWKIIDCESDEEFVKEFDSVDQMLDVIAPSGVANIRARVPGVGRLMLVIDSEQDGVVLTNMRTMETEGYSWSNFSKAMSKLWHKSEDWKESYYAIYCEVPENIEVAPVQQPVENKPVKSEEKALPKTEKPKQEKQVKTGNEVPKTREVQEDIREVEEKESEVVQASAQNDNVARGYKAAVTNNLHQLNICWNNEENKMIAAKKMLTVLEDLKWRLEQIMKGVN